jgi:hypothetical protein
MAALDMNLGKRYLQGLKDIVLWPLIFLFAFYFPVCRGYRASATGTAATIAAVRFFKRF